MNDKNNSTTNKATTQLEQTLVQRVKELEQINLRLQGDIEARKLAQEGLRYGQKFLREVISSIEDTYITVFDKNCQVNFIWGSNKLEEKYGIVFQDYMGKDSNEFNSSLTKQIRQVFETNQSFHGEWYDERQGNKIWWDFTLSTIRDEDNEMVAVVSAAKDITERKEMEEELIKSENYLDLIFNSISDSIAVLDPITHEIKSINKTFLTEYNLKENDVIGKKCYEVIHHQTTACKSAICPLELCLKTGKISSLEHIHNLFDGAKKYCEVTVSPLINETKQIKEVIHVEKDITERRKAEQKLKENEEKFRIISEQALMSILIYQDDVIKYFNDAFLFLIEYSREEVESLVGKSIFNLIHAEDRDYVRRQASKKHMGLTEGIIPHYSYRIIKKTGKTVWVENYSKTIEYGGKSADLVLLVDITESKKLYDNLQESERNLKRALKIAQIGHWYLNPITQEVSGSDELFNIFGFTEKEINLDAFVEVVHPDDREYDLYHIQRGMTHGESWDIEHHLLLKDGTEKYVHVIGEAIKDETGKVNLMMGTVQDITELKKTMEKLSESEERYRSFVKNYRGIAFRGDKNSIPIFFHGAVKEITGYTEQEFVEGKLPWFNLNHPDDLPSKEMMYKMLNTPDYAIQREYRIIRKEGQIRWVFESTQNIFDGDGKFIGVQGTINDITDLKRTEEALRESEEIMRSILENSPDYIIMMDKEGLIQFVNHPLPGMKMSDFHYKNIFSIISSEYHEIMKDRISQLFKRGKVRSVKFKIQNPSGFSAFYEARFGALKRDWKIYGIIMIFTDISDHEKIEVELRESEERFRRVIERSPLPITIINIDGKREYQNPKFIKNYGYLINEMPTIGDWFKAVHPNDQYRQKIIEAWNINRIKIKTQKIKPSTLKIRCKDGNFRTVIVKMEYLGDNRIFFTHEDIAELLKT